MRLAALEQFRALNQTHGIPVREAAELIGVPLANLYRWRKRYRANRVGGLRSRSRRPRRCPRKRWSPELTRRLIQLRKQHPSWGKRKLTVLLQREGYAVSESTVGRRISDLLRRGRIARSPRRAKRERLPRTRPWAKRGWGGLVKTVGKVVQVDTMTVTPHYGFRFKQFTAVDVASRYTGRSAVLPGHRDMRGALPRSDAGADAVPGAGDPGGWRWRVLRRVRAGLPGAEPAADRAAAAFAEDEQPGGIRARDLPPRVLRVHGDGGRPGGGETAMGRVGGHLQPGPAA